MGNAAIVVEGLGKRYRVGEMESYQALRDVLARAASSAFKGREKSSKDYLWALRDVSFEVGEGEVVGLIGRNGAGKSTLLKVLARIVRPTLGWAEIHGRVGSLLEVGTGFHPELTGRENVYLCGAVLGMRRAEIDLKFDEIVAFAEVESFLDTPLKRYSSGMQTRLAFAVAAHLEPEILLVDEVLAVGDLEFQKRCLGKMHEVARGGRTVIFVSHNLAAVNALCPRAILLDRGGISTDGPTATVLAAYQVQGGDPNQADADLSSRPRKGSGKARFLTLTYRALDEKGRPIPSPTTGCDLEIETTVEAHEDLPDSNVAVIIYDGGGYRLIDANLNQRNEFLELRAGQKARVSFVLREVLLKPGPYLVGLWLGRNNIEEIDSIEYAAMLEVMHDPDQQAHSVVFPGPYLCRFDSNVTSLVETMAR